MRGVNVCMVIPADLAEVGIDRGRVRAFEADRLVVQIRTEDLAAPESRGMNCVPATGVAK
jgi:hypothetical protein